MANNQREDNPNYRKSYNPFKMWGGWVGVIPIIVLMILSPIIYNFGGCDAYGGGKHFDLFGTPDYFNVGGPNCEGLLFMIGSIIFVVFMLPPLMLLMSLHLASYFGSSQSFLLLYPLCIVINFFIGWGIHSLIRKLRKK